MPLNHYEIEHGTLFRTRERATAESESALREHLMKTRPEIFPVQITPALTLEPKYTDTWHQKPKRGDVPFICGGRS